MTTEVSKVVKVTILDSPTFPARKGFGILNIIGSSTKLPLGRRVSKYTTIDDVAKDFATTDEEYKAANIFFSQSPRPTDLVISRRLLAAAPGELLTGTGLEQDINVWKAITTGAFKITLDGGAESAISAVNFSTAATLDDVATLLQTKLAAALAGTTCVYNSTYKQFIIKSPTTGASSSVSYLSAPASGVDITTLLKGTAALGAISTAGKALETADASLSAIQDIDQSWYGFAFTKEATEAELKLAAAWAESRVKIFGYATNNSAVLVAATTTDIASYMKTQGYARTFGVWDDNDDYPQVSAMARAFTVNFNEQNSTLTLKFKILPGISPSTLTESQRLSIVGKNANYYTTFGESRMLAEGVMANGKFFDERHGLDWLQNAIETNVFGYLYTRTTKVPQTDKGVAQIVSQVESALREGVRNGLLAPGVWRGIDLGEIKSGDYLTKGFYVYAQSVDEQNQSDREARKAPPIQALCKGAGAIHFVDITVTFER